MRIALLKFIVFSLIPLAGLLAVFRALFSYPITGVTVSFVLLLAIVHYVILERLSAARTRKLLEEQKRMLSDISHDLRAPLSIVKVNSEVALIEGERLSAEEALKTIQSNLEEIDRMSHMLRIFTDSARIDSLRNNIFFARFNIFDLVTKFTRYLRA